MLWQRSSVAWVDFTAKIKLRSIDRGQTTSTNEEIKEEKKKSSRPNAAAIFGTSSHNDIDNK